MSQSPLSIGIDGFGWLRGEVESACLDLNKDNSPAIEGDDIDFAVAMPEARGYDPVASASQVFSGGKFAALTKSLSLLRKT